MLSEKTTLALYQYIPDEKKDDSYDHKSNPNIIGYLDAD